MNLKAFHGTTKTNCDLIYNNGFKPKTFVIDIKRKNDLPGDLGAGTYGFVEDKDLAFKFATKFNPPNVCGVIEMDINVNDDEILDFDDEHNHTIFLGAKTRSLKFAQTLFKQCTGNRNCIDGIIIELLITYSKQKYKVVKKKTYTPIPEEFLETRAGKKPATSNFYNGTEICIRDLNVITNKNVCM